MKTSIPLEGEPLPNGSKILRTVIVCAIDFLLFVGLPYMLVSQPGASTALTLMGLDSGTLVYDLAFFALLLITLTVVRNFTRTGTIINLAAGLFLIGIGLAFFFYLGSFNASQPRLGLLTFFVPTGNSRIAVTVDYFWLALAWVLVAGLKIVNVILEFIEARRSRVVLRLPPVLQPVQVPARSAAI